jgi:predicted SAM-dependent methyltransferase
MLGNLKSIFKRYAHAALAPVRLIQFDLKRSRTLKRSRRMFDDYLNAPGPKCLQVGCGKAIREGWLNTDIEWDDSRVAYLDATKPYPLPPNSFDFALSEHQIEHISWDMGQAMLKQLHIVLKPGGVIRVATPDQDQFIKLAAASNLNDVQKRYLAWSAGRHLAPGQADPAFVVNMFFNSWGHTFIYNRRTLRMALEQAGFVNITESRPRISDHEAFRGIDYHAVELQSDEMNDFETIIFEGTKPPAVAAQHTSVRVA